MAGSSARPPGRADRHRDPPRGHLGEGKVEFQRRRLGRVVGAHVGHHADDFMRLGPVADVFADRVLPGPEAAHEGLVHDRGLGRAGAVAIREQAAPAQAESASSGSIPLSTLRVNIGGMSRGLANCTPSTGHVPT